MNQLRLHIGGGALRATRCLVKPDECHPGTFAIHDGIDDQCLEQFFKNEQAAWKRVPSWDRAVNRQKN